MIKKIILIILCSAFVHIVKGESISNTPSATAKIEISLPDSIDISCVKLLVFTATVSGTSERNIPDTIYYSRRVRSRCFFGISLTKPVVNVTLYAGCAIGGGYSEINMFPMFPLEVADSLVITVPDHFLKEPASLQNFEFSGRGSGKLSCLRKMQLEASHATSVGGFFSSDGSINGNYFTQLVRSKQMQVLREYHDSLSKVVYSILLIKSYSTEMRYRCGEFASLASKSEPIRRSRLLEIFQSDYLKLLEFADSSAFTLSPEYGEYRSYFDVTEARIRGVPHYLEAVFAGYLSMPDSDLKNKLMFSFLNVFGTVLPRYDEKISVLESHTVNGPWERYRDSYSRIRSGKIAHFFELSDISGNRVNLDRFKGKIIYIDFWFTGCGPCQLFYKNTLKPIEDKFRDDSRIVFVKVSIDKDFNVWRRSVEGGNYSSPNGQNFYTSGLGSSHPIIEYYKITGYPAPILIDTAGLLVQGSSIFDLKRGEYLLRLLDEMLRKGE